MLVKTELVNKIKDYFDLNVYETKVWLALLGKGVASAGEISNISGVPRSRTYDVLESLEKKGFAIVKIGKPVKYLGVKPQIILERLKNNVKKQAYERISNLSDIKETLEFEQLNQLYNKGIDPVKKENLSVSLKGKSSISNHLKELLKSAEKEVIICTDAEEIKSKINLFKNTFESLKKSKIDIKLALLGEEKTINFLSNSLNIPIKKIDISAKFFIIDRSQILFYVSKNPQEDIAIWLNSDFFADAFALLLDKALKTNKLK